MTTEEAQKVLDELQNVRPEVLTGEAKRLFEAIMKIADTRDEALIENRKLETIVDLMAKYISEIDVSENLCKEGACLEDADHCKVCIKHYFENIAKEDKQCK